MENIELTPSVPPVVTPSEEPKVDPPAEVTPEVTPAVPATELFKMPDGRELTGAQVKEEYEKLLPEFTIKSQKLADIERAKNDADNVPEWEREGYVPKSYAEIIKIAKQQAVEDIAKVAEAEEAERARVTALVESQVSGLKIKDPKLDESALFAHANKYGFRDLNLAYENMQEMRKVALTTEERVLAGQKKKIDPIAGNGGAGGGGSAPRYAPASTANEFLARIKGK